MTLASSQIVSVPSEQYNKEDEEKMHTMYVAGTPLILNWIFCTLTTRRFLEFFALVSLSLSMLNKLKQNRINLKTNI